MTNTPWRVYTYKQHLQNQRIHINPVAYVFWGFIALLMLGLIAWYAW